MHRSRIVFCFVTALAILPAAKRSDAQTLQTLATFSTQSSGPWEDRNDLTLSGSTLYGTSALSDSIFSVPVSGGTITRFAGGDTPFGAPTVSGGTIYGSSFYGDDVYSLPTSGGALTILASTSGLNQSGSLILSGGTLYGAAIDIFNNDDVIFSLPATGGTPTVLATFNNLAEGWDVNQLTLVGSTLYGTAYYGGAYGGPNGDGTIFSVPTAGGTPTVLASFNGTDGQGPAGGLTLSADGSTFYGTTYTGGAYGDGTIYSIPIAGGTPTVLASLDVGYGSASTLTLVGSTLYGTTLSGGPFNDGTIFSLPTTGGTPTVLWSFTDGADGAGPTPNLVAGNSTLYGMTSAGGSAGYGTVFALMTPEPSSRALLSFGSLALGAMVLRRKTGRQFEPDEQTAA